MTDLQRQMDTATAFFLAGERCVLELKFDRYRLHSVHAPTVVNYALAVEIALKIIYSLCNGGRFYDHDLKKLYDLLPDDSKANMPHLAHYGVEISKYFTAWRYPYEQAFLAGNFQLTRRAFIECYTEIRRLDPRIISVYEKNWGAFDPEWIQLGSDIQPKYALVPVAV